MQSCLKHKSVLKPLRVGTGVVGCSGEVSRDSTMENTRHVQQEFRGEKLHMEKDQDNFYRKRSISVES